MLIMDSVTNADLSILWCFKKGFLNQSSSAWYSLQRMFLEYWCTLANQHILYTCWELGLGEGDRLERWESFSECPANVGHSTDGPLGKTGLEKWIKYRGGCGQTLTHLTKQRALETEEEASYVYDT